MSFQNEKPNIPLKITIEWIRRKDAYILGKYLYFKDQNNGLEKYHYVKHDDYSMMIVIIPLSRLRQSLWKFRKSITDSLRFNLEKFLNRYLVYPLK